ncbi:hypothetical protein MHYP_G00284410 [Metynnis hypsauchen]
MTTPVSVHLCANGRTPAELDLQHRFSWESSRCPEKSVSARTSAKCNSVLIMIFFTPNVLGKVDKRWRTSSFMVGVDETDWMMPVLRAHAPPTDRTRGLVGEMDNLSDHQCESAAISY